MRSNMRSTVTASLLLLLLQMVVVSVVVVVVDATAYYATLAPFGEYSDQIQMGYARVFTSRRHPTVIAYYGSIRAVSPNLSPMVDCTLPNACGAHIHAGYSCESVVAQGGHLFNNVTVPVDPWLMERYRSDANGIGRYDGVLDQGTNDVNGRAFVVHNETGGRIACGILLAVPPREEQEANNKDDDDDHYYYYDDDDDGDNDTYMCPPYSTVVRGIRQLQSFRQSCRCREGFYPRSRAGGTIGICVAQSCDSQYQCPTHARPRGRNDNNNSNNKPCLRSIVDCVCNDGYRKSGGYCVATSGAAAVAETAPVVSTTTTGATSNYIGV